MHIAGTQPNKYELFQEFYYITNGVQLTYKRAVELFYQMDKVTKNEFCKFYADKNDYQLIYKKDSSGNILLDDDGNAIILNIPYTSANGYGVDCTIKETDLVKAKNPDGSDKTRPDKGFHRPAQHAARVDGVDDVQVYESKLANLNKAYIGMQYSIEAYAAKNGLILDPTWSIYSAEEIIQMENEGVNIPQEILNIAHTILEGSGENYEGNEDEEGSGEPTTERASFLDLIPKAEKKIEKCYENREKIDDKIDDLLDENESNQKSMFAKQKDQLEELKEYEEKIREWRHLQDKINNGEELTDSEAKKYAKITGMLQDRNKSSDDFGLNKNKIAFSLNEINILAVLGEKLAQETIEIGDLLSDYISIDNYKRTRSDVMGEIGILRGTVAMANGKVLAKEASTVGNETKEYTEDTSGTVNDIAGVLGVENMLANSGAANATDATEPTEVTQAEDESAVEGEGATQPAKADDDEQTEEESAQSENDTNEEDFLINDENVLNLIKEAGEINIDLLKEIKDALVALKMAKDDKDFAKSAGKYIDKLVQQFEQEEQERQEEIRTKEQENKEAQDRIDELQGDNDENDLAEQYGVKTEEEQLSNEDKAEIEEKRELIEQNNQDIEALKLESESAKEEFKQRVQKPKDIIAKAIPEEMEALERDNEYKDEIIPEDIEQLDFTSSSGGTLFKMGKYRITVGLEMIAAGIFCPPLRVMGLYHIAKGTASAVIGATAKVVSNIPTPQVADKVVSASTENEDKAIEGLNEIDAKICGITGDQTEAEKYEAVHQDDEDGENGEDGADGSDGTDGTGDSSDDAGSGNAGEPPVLNASQTSTTGAVSGELITTDPETGATDNPEDGNPVDNNEDGTDGVDDGNPVDNNEDGTDGVDDGNPVDNNEDGTDVVDDGKDTDDAVDDTDDNEDESTESTANNKTKSSKKKEELTTDKAEDNVKNAEDDGKEIAKDSEKVKKDTEKDEKQLEKETKRLTKEMKRDQQLITKMTKESLRAAKKQEELLAKYEELVAENEQIAAEEESKQNSAPAQQQQTQQTAQQAGQVGGASAVAGGAIVTNSAQSSSADNQSKLDANNQQITTISGQFKVQGNIITRNRTKILKLQKSNKTKNKKFEKKTKIREKKIQEANKKEQEKQQKLAKQLGVVGVAENLFNITMTTGSILMMSIFTYAAGLTMFTIGLKGIVYCGLVKAIINLANGNSMAALMGIAQMAVTVVGSAVGAGGACSNVMGAVSAGLSIVASSAEMVNNVRAIQGKEASGVFSKISAIAGAASAVAGAASALGSSTTIIKDGAGKLVEQTSEGIFKSASSFGKAMQIASMVGQALSSASQLMNEFGWGDEDTRNLLGTIGSAVSMAASVGQMAESAKNKASEKNKDANEKVKDADGADSPDSTKGSDGKDGKKPEKADKTDGNGGTSSTEESKPQTKEEKQQTKAEKKAQKRAEKQQAKADKKAEKQAKRELKAERKEEKRAEKQQKKAEKKAKKNEGTENSATTQVATPSTTSSPSSQPTVTSANQPAPEQAVAAAAQSNANTETMQNLQNNNDANTSVVDNSADAVNETSVKTKKQDGTAKPVETPKSSETPGKVGEQELIDIKDIPATQIAPDAPQLDEANIQATMAEVSEKVKKDIAQGSDKKPKLTKQEQDKQDIELAKKERTQQQKDAKTLTEDDLMTTNENGEQVRATHADGTDVTLAEARANMTVRGASKEFATMDDKMLQQEITSLDAELAPVSAGQNSDNNSQNQDGKGSSSSNTSENTTDKTPEQVRTEKQERLNKLRAEQEKRKGYQDRQEKLRKQEKSDNWELAGKAAGKLVEGITQGAALFASNDEEEEKKPKYLAGHFTERTKKIMQAHKSMIKYYGGTTSVQNQEEYLKKLKKQPMQVNALAGRYLA